MFYEAKNLLKANDLKIEHGKNLSFPLHLHGSFEFITVTEGEMKVVVDKVEYLLKSGQALMIFPNQAHEFLTEQHSSHYLCIFSPDLVRAYSKVCLAKVPKSNLFSVDAFYVEKLKNLQTNASVAEVKGLIYSICGEFDENCVIYPKKEHTPGEWAVSREPSYDREGEETTSCTVCGTNLIRESPDIPSISTCLDATPKAAIYRYLM